jgi:hypothetical protein
MMGREMGREVGRWGSQRGEILRRVGRNAGSKMDRWAQRGAEREAEVATGRSKARRRRLARFSDLHAHVLTHACPAPLRFMRARPQEFPVALWATSTAGFSHETIRARGGAQIGGVGGVE